MALLFDKQFVIACIASLILIYFFEQLSNFDTIKLYLQQTLSDMIATRLIYFK